MINSFDEPRDFAAEAAGADDDQIIHPILYRTTKEHEIFMESTEYTEKPRRRADKLLYVLFVYNEF